MITVIMLEFTLWAKSADQADSKMMTVTGDHRSNDTIAMDRRLDSAAIIA